MSKIIAIGLNTFKEAVRNKVLYFLLIFALLIMGFSGVISDLSIGAPVKLIKDLGLASIDFFAFLIAVFVGVYLVYTELDKKTIYTIVSKPIDRYQFILGKFFGLLFTIAVNMAVMSIFFFAVLYFREATEPEQVMKALRPEISPGVREELANFQFHYYLFHAKMFVVAVGKAIITLFGYSEPITYNLIKVVLMSALGMAIVTSFAILYSTFSTPTLSAVFTFLTFVIGSLVEDILRYADRLVQKVGSYEALGPDKFKYWFATIAAHITPNLALFDLRTQAVHGISPDGSTTAHIVTVDPMAVLYGFVYVAAVLSLASLIFRRRNFK